jgi:hypothetical protein
MKNLLKISLVIVALYSFVACKKDEESKSSASENQIVAKIDGKDSIYTINKATLKQFSDHQQLSIITTLSGTCIDFYVIAPEVTAKEYPIYDGYGGNLPSEFSHGWYRILLPNSMYTARAFYSKYSAADYKVVITQITDKEVKGTLKFMGVDWSSGSEDTRIVEGTFSTNLLVLE